MGTGAPPFALTRMRGAVGDGEKRITAPGPQAPPRPSGASQIICVPSDSLSTVLSLPSAKNPRERLSGDQKGKVASSLPGRARASTVFVRRTQSAVLPSAPVVANAMYVPSGESTGGPAESPVRLNVVFSGGSMTARMERPG